MNRLLISFSFLILLLGQPAIGQGASEEERNCIDRSGGVTSEMLKCVTLSYQTADASLNKAWLELSPKLDSLQKKAFRDAQRDWISFRDTTCTAEAVLQTGSFASVALIDCKARLTSERLRWFESAQPG